MGHPPVRLRVLQRFVFDAGGEEWRFAAVVIASIALAGSGGCGGSG